MSCNDPRKVFYVGINNETGKRKILFTSRYVDYVWRRNPHDNWHTVRIPESQTETHGIRNYEQYKEHLANIDTSTATVCRDFDFVPCGQCIGCRMDYARSWATRIVLESKNYDPGKCWFVTFTYDDDHLPKYRDVKEEITINNKTKKYWFCQKYIVDNDTGELKEPAFPSVSKRQHELLMKKIRKHYGKDIRFFMSAEYGSKSCRCHMHYILFGLPRPADLKYYKKNWQGDIYYTSDEFTKTVWSDENGKPKGYVIFGEVNDQTAAYVARYTIKKRNVTSKEAYESLGIEPEFCLMSRKPGIGNSFFEDNYKSMYDIDSVTIPSKNGAITTKPPKYYDSLLERYDPDLLETIKEERKIKRQDHDKTMSIVNPNLDLNDIYESSERRAVNKIIIKKEGDI